VAALPVAEAIALLIVEVTDIHVCTRIGIQKDKEKEGGAGGKEGTISREMDEPGPRKGDIRVKESARSRGALASGLLWPAVTLSHVKDLLRHSHLI